MNPTVHIERRAAPDTPIAAVWSLLADVMDPEIPVLSVLDLGIVRSIRIDGDEVIVAVAPTYSACPAMELIEQDIAEAVADGGFAHVTVERVLSPPWTTDWISDEGREKLERYGIAPPAGRSGVPSPPPACPRCASTDTARLSEFGSTPCKAAWRCNTCLEPFEHFKCI